jgi:hypothetical protein
LGFEVDCPCATFPKVDHNSDDDDGGAVRPEDRKCCVVTTANGDMKIQAFKQERLCQFNFYSLKIVWNRESKIRVNEYLPPLIDGDSDCALTALCLTADRCNLLAGTAHGFEFLSRFEKFKYL